MKFYIVDDNRSVVKVLDRIIEQRKLGDVLGFSTDASTAVEKIIAKEPDIVLVDLLMPIKDGLMIVNEVKGICPDIKFIMISQVVDKELVSEAYRVGVEFFIHKPIVITEVETVVKQVTEKLQMEAMLGGIRAMFNETQNVPGRVETVKKDTLKEIKYLLGILGMMGERGTKDILAICEKCLDKGRDFEKADISEYCLETGEDEKMALQRMRRAVRKGLTNLAHMGIEDYYGETFQSYSQFVFDFESLKAEMDYIRGNREIGGKANVGKFIEGLLLFYESKQ